MHTELGKITKAVFGFGGYQDVQVVFEIHVGGKSWGSCMTFEGGWGHVSKEELTKPESTYKWTHESRVKQIGEAAWSVIELMKAAKVETLDKLVGVPIRATFDGPCGRIRNVEVLEECV